MSDNKYLIGCNYWASNLGIYMWKNYDKKIIRKDMRLLSSHGVNCIRVFPLWPDFQPLTEIRFVNAGADTYFPFKMRTGDKPLPFQKFPNSGLNEEQVANFKHLLTTAEEFGIKVIVSIVTGWMSGRKLVPEPFISRDLVKDSEVVLYECAFIKDLIGEIKEHKNIIAYEPGNETNCLSFEVDRFQAELWLKVITDTIRSADPTKPVYAGMHGTSCKGNWNLLTQSKYFDMVTPHPYPCFTEYCINEKLTAFRASMHAASESSYYASIAGLPSMVQEIGVMGQMYLSNDYVPEYFENALMTSYASGSKGFLWWCAFEQTHLDFAPYDVNACEADLGLAFADHTPKPVLKKLAELRKDIDEIGILPEPKKDACVIVTNNVDHWGVAYGSYMLGVQAGYNMDYTYEEQVLKESDFYILPCLGDNCGLNKYNSKLLEERIKKGAKLLVTYNGGAMWDFEALTGLKILGKENVAHTKTFIVNGKRVKVDCAKNVELVATTAKILAKDEEDRIVLTENKVGKGSVMFLNAPLEMHYVQMNYPENTELFETYKYFLKTKKKVIDVKENKTYVTVHEIDAKKTGVMIYNFSKKTDTIPVKIGDGYKVSKTLFGTLSGGKLKFEKKYVYLELTK